MKINPLTSAEESLMQVIWKLEKPFMKDIIEAYPEPKPHHNTISTYLKILVEKEFLTTEKVGRINQYKVTVPFADYKKFILKHFLENYYDNSAKVLVQNLISEKLIKEADLLDFIESKIQLPDKNEETIPERTEISAYIEELTNPKKKKKKAKNKKKKSKKDKKSE